MYRFSCVRPIRILVWHTIIVPHAHCSYTPCQYGSLSGYTCPRSQVDAGQRYSYRPCRLLPSIITMKLHADTDMPIPSHRYRDVSKRYCLSDDMTRVLNHNLCFICDILCHQVWQNHAKGMPKCRSSRVRFCLVILKDQ